MEQNIEELKYPIGRYQKPLEYDPAMRSEWIGVLKALPSWMDACIENLDERQAQSVALQRDMCPLRGLVTAASRPDDAVYSTGARIADTAHHAISWRCAIALGAVACGA